MGMVFWANVNPKNHPRWSQKTERILGGERKTEIYNGYGPEVSAHVLFLI